MSGTAVEDITMFTVPEEIAHYPDEDLRGFAWWQLMGYLVNARRLGDLPTHYPVDNIDIVLCRTTAEVNAITLRHDCPECHDGLDKARKAVLNGHIAVVMQFTHYDSH